MKRIRLGVDVGGTFTHAVAYDVDARALVAAHMVPTTHTHEKGVAAGIVRALKELMTTSGLDPASIVLVAHSTTQATNALLEGDTARVGILGIGSGALSALERAQCRVGRMALAPGHSLDVLFAFVEGPSPERIEAATGALRDAGAQVIVASQAFAVDDPGGEALALAAIERAGLPGTAAAELAPVYGLRQRTRTACVNAAILPRMLETADRTRQAACELGLSAPLMIVRSDGGIMDLAQVRRRPILTILSGPAAGVAGALAYSRVSDGIFLEVGGTSTDIACLCDGRARHRAARIGGHHLLMRTLDVHTVGVAGGSLPRVDDRGRPVGVGPRSAHIAGLTYASYTPDLRAQDLELAPVFEGDVRYLAFRRRGDPGAASHSMGTASSAASSAPPAIAFTVTCAAAVLGHVPAAGERAPSVAGARAALEAWARATGEPADALARRLLDLASQSVEPEVRALIADYHLDLDLVVLVGGGGGAYAIVPALAKRMGLRYHVVDHSPVISSIGAACALLRETVERSVSSPGAAEILAMRREILEKVVAGGARRETVEVEVEVDAVRGIVRASASGASTLEPPAPPPLDDAALERAAGDGAPARVLASTGALHVFAIGRGSRALVRVLDGQGRVRLQRRGAQVLVSTTGTLTGAAPAFLEDASRYGDAGRELSESFLLHRERVVDLSGMTSLAPLVGLIAEELAGCDAAEPAHLIAAPRP